MLIFFFINNLLLVFLSIFQLSSAMRIISSSPFCSKAHILILLQETWVGVGKSISIKGYNLCLALWMVSKIIYVVQFTLFFVIKGMLVKEKKFCRAGIELSIFDM